MHNDAEYRTLALATVLRFLAENRVHVAPDGAVRNHPWLSKDRNQNLSPVDAPTQRHTVSRSLPRGLRRIKRRSASRLHLRGDGGWIG